MAKIDLRDIPTMDEVAADIVAFLKEEDAHEIRCAFLEAYGKTLWYAYPWWKKVWLTVRGWFVRENW